MRNAIPIAILLALFIPARAWADKESDCQKGITTLKSELKKKHPKPMRDQLQKALKDAQKEDGEGDWDECVDAVKAGTRALGR
ncbi:MAG TPA: hypothetical protein VF913_03000 [Xanthobacteraceae bacterium]